MKSDEIYRQKPINRQNYGFSQKLILYICTQTINTYHYGAEKDRTYNIASDCFWYNRHHWCFSPPNRTSLWLGRVQQLPYSCSMLYCHWSNLSNTPEFAEALVEDGQRILSLYNNLPVEKQTAFLTRIRQDSAHSFSDLIDATTNGQLHGNYGHSRNYWTRPGNLQAEAFAHFFEASMGDQGKLELLANFFPTAFGIFSSMIDSIRPDNHVRVLSRER